MGNEGVGSGGLALVSVFFEPELALQRLQAASVARFVPPGYFRAIRIIDNTQRGIESNVAGELIDAFDDHRDHVRILRPNDVDRLPAATGWWSQQVLKLSIARQLDASHYLVLDAKNHFVAVPDECRFVTADGRARVSAYSFAEHPLRHALERTIEYVGLSDPEGLIDHFTSTTTPFTFETARVATMMGQIEAESGRPFATEFVRSGLTEFFLYSAWAIRDGERLEDVFDLTAESMPAVWPRRADVEGVRGAVAQAAASGAPLFSVHRRAYQSLPQDARRELAEYWRGCGLFATVELGEAFAESVASSADEFEHAQRWRGLRLKIVGRLRRGVARLKR